MKRKTSDQEHANLSSTLQQAGNVFVVNNAHFSGRLRHLHCGSAGLRPLPRACCPRSARSRCSSRCLSVDIVLLNIDKVRVVERRKSAKH